MVYEGLLHVTGCQVLGKLPDLFTFDNGTPVVTPTDWEKRRAEMYKTAVELQYGIQPPKPEFLEVELLYRGTETIKKRYPGFFEDIKQLGAEVILS